MDQPLKSCLEHIIAEGTAEQLAVRYGKLGNIMGELYCAEQKEPNETTLFDMASVTKIAVTLPLTLIAIDRGLLHIEDSVCRFYPTSTEDQRLSIFHLLTHTTGTGYRFLGVDGVNYTNVGNYILDLPREAPIGSEVQYSCPGYILLAKILEKIYNMRLDDAFYRYVAEPLGMENSRFYPIAESAVGSPLVNDANCRFLGGIAGNAGLFSCVCDMTKYAKMLFSNGAPIIRADTMQAAMRNHTFGMSESRGLGFLYVDERYSQTGKLFPTGSIGHCGHTGQSLFLDPFSGFYALILSDMTSSTIKKYGAERYDLVMKARCDIHNAILNEINSPE